MIEIEHVTKRFGPHEALRGVDASFGAARLSGLVGPDGSGKTTLLRLMAGLLLPSTGRITIDGCDTRRDAAEIRMIAGYMPQRFGLYEDLTVDENLALHARLRRLRGAAKQRALSDALSFTRLGPFGTRLAGKLSGGMKQKLGLACALLARPAVLLLDEPSVGVDPLSRRELWAIVRSLVADGMAVIWSTAYLDEAERCDHVLLLNDGGAAFAGDPAQLSARIADRSFHVRGVTGDRRRVLAGLLQQPGVRDGVIQGEALRIVVGAAEPALAAGHAARDVVRELERVAAAHGATLAPVRPSFEDAFIDLLGGGPGGDSALAERFEPVKLDDQIAVSCRELTKRFGDFTAADRITLDVRRGEIFGLLGPNGAGKSTTFKMLCGLLKPTSGTARVAGHDVARAAAAAKQRVGYMAQKFSLYGLLSVRQNLEFFAGIYQLAGSLRRARIEEMIETLDLRALLNRAPKDLPLGYQQRLALACALLHRPAVLFLDEPTSGVDPITRREFWMHINGLVQRGVTIMVTTHFMDEAEYCDRVAMIDRARLIAVAPPDALKARAASPRQPSPTMEDAFVAMIEAHGRGEEHAA